MLMKSRIASDFLLSRSTETVEEQTQKTVTRENFRNNQYGQCTGKTEIVNISDDFWHPNHRFHKYMFFEEKSVCGVCLI